MCDSHLIIFILQHSAGLEVTAESQTNKALIPKHLSDCFVVLF